MVVPVTPQSDKVARLADRARHLTALHESPSYPIYRDILQAKIDRETERFISTPVVSQQELDYGRGLMNGLRAALTILERGEQEFQRAMKLAQTLDEEQ